MTRDESLQIVGMILHYWHSRTEWTKEEIDVYARMIQDLDVELTISALTKAAKEIAYRPAISELRERVRVEKRRLAPTVAPLEVKTTPLPFWVKRWICARMLYKQFGKDQDLRRFVEQGDWGDQTKEVMPDGVWEQEASSMSDEQFSKAFAKLLRT